MARRRVAKAEQNGGNGNGSAAVTDIGQGTASVVPLPSAPLAEVRNVLGRLAELHRQLGALTEDFEARRAALLRAIAEGRREYVELVRKQATDLGLIGTDSQSAWTFNPDKGEFVRQQT